MFRLSYVRLGNDVSRLDSFSFSLPSVVNGGQGKMTRGATAKIQLEIARQSIHSYKRMSPAHFGTGEICSWAAQIPISHSHHEELS